MRLTEPFQTLAAADMVVLGPFGYAAERLPALDAFDAAKPLAAQHAEQLEWMLHHGTACGKWYAAALIQSVDSRAGLEAWRRLSADTTEIRLAEGGCGVVMTTLAAYAQSRLSAGVDAPGLPNPAPEGPDTSGGLATWIGALLIFGIPIGAILVALIWLIVR